MFVHLCVDLAVQSTVTRLGLVSTTSPPTEPRCGSLLLVQLKTSLGFAPLASMTVSSSPCVWEPAISQSRLPRRLCPSLLSVLVACVSLSQSLGLSVFLSPTSQPYPWPSSVPCHSQGARLPPLSEPPYVSSRVSGMFSLTLRISVPTTLSGRPGLRVLSPLRMVP